MKVYQHAHRAVYYANEGRAAYKAESLSSDLRQSSPLLQASRRIWILEMLSIFSNTPAKNSFEIRNKGVSALLSPTSVEFFSLSFFSLKKKQHREERVSKSLAPQVYGPLSQKISSWRVLLLRCRCYATRKREKCVMVLSALVRIVLFFLSHAQSLSFPRILGGLASPEPLG